MMKQLNRILLIMATVLTVLTTTAIPTMAQTSDSSDFTVKALLPDNQIDKKQTFFDLRMKPDQKQNVKVEVFNTGKEDLTVDVLLRAASTNRNGIIEYQVKVPPDETLLYPFDEISQTTSEITVPAGSSKIATVSISMPKETFDGAILGSIVFTKRLDNKENTGVSINNQFSYVVGVKLTETNAVIKPDFKLKSIVPTLINYRSAVVANIQNPVPLIVKETNVTADIFKKGDKDPLFSVDKNNVDMAPNSVYPLPVEWEGKDMEPGDYTLHLKVNHKGTIFEWNENFAITADQAGELNDNALTSQPARSMWATWWWVPILIIGILVLWWILGRRRGSKERQ